MSPIRVKAWRKTALSAAMTTSAASARFAPAPAAAPFTAEITGAGLVDRSQHGNVFVAHRAFEVTRADRRLVAEVLTRAERLARPREHQDPRRALGGLYRVEDLGAHLCIEGVAHLGAREGDDADVPVDGEAQGLVIHRLSLLRRFPDR